MSILNYFVKPNLRSKQAEVLCKIEEAWPDYDVLCIQAPTGTGKSAVAMTVAKWAQAEKRIRSANILAPENVHIDHYEKEFPELNVLKKAGAYKCHRFKGKTCGGFRPKDRCRECVFNKQKRSVVNSNLRLMNYHTYVSNRLLADLVIFDEAHKLPDILYQMQDYKIWSHDYKFPDNLKTLEDVLVWLGQEYKQNPKKKTKAIIDDLSSVTQKAVCLYNREKYRGEYSDVLCIRRLNVAGDSGILWPKQTRKIVLMSATINEKDLIELGLDRKRFKVISVDSEIPAVNRQILCEPRYKLAYDNLDRSKHLLAYEINKLLDKHPEKGLIHLPYGIVTLIKPLLSNERLLWHTSDNKKQVLERFKSSDPNDGKVMVASGMYVGVDLPYEEARWQLIGKVPFPSLGDPFIKTKSKLDSDWYAWQTVKTVLQGVGRIVRAPDDFGITYILDANFVRLYNQNPKFFPLFFRTAVQIRSKD